jgi:hypothetical protein
MKTNFREWFSDFIKTYDWTDLRSVETSAYFCDIVTADLEYWQPHLHMLERAGIDDLPMDASILDLGTWFGVLPFALKQYGFTNVHTSDRMTESDFKRKEFDYLWNHFDIEPFDLTITADEQFELPQQYDLIMMFESNFYWKTNKVFCYDGSSINSRWQVQDSAGLTHTFFSPFDTAELQTFNTCIADALKPAGRALIHPRPWVYAQPGLESESEYLAQFQQGEEYSKPSLSIRASANTDYYVVKK